MKLMNLSSKESIIVSHKGNSYSIGGIQPKIKNGDYYCKLDSPGASNGVIEELVSNALDYITFNGEIVDHVKYYYYTDGNDTGCTCKEYKISGEQELTLDAIMSNLNLDELPFKDTIAKYFVCDMIFYNEDRHFGNLPFLYTESYTRLAPLFDFGNALSFYGEPDYDMFKPEPFGRAQIEWALNLSRDCSIKYSLTDFEYAVKNIELGYDDLKIKYILKKIHLCAISDFVQSFVEVL